MTLTGNDATSTPYSMGVDIPSNDLTSSDSIPQMTALVDWVAFTFRPGSTTLNEVLQSLTPTGDSLDSWHTTVGGHGYRSCKRRQDISVYYDGHSHMGIHVQLTGKGCRQAESEQLLTNGNWQETISDLLYTKGVRFSRLDIAFDDRSNLFTLADVVNKARTGLVSGWFKKGCDRQDIDLNDGSETGHSFTFGQPKSETKVVVYDKAKQTGTKGTWVRVEMQVHKRKAHDLAQHVALHGLDGVAGILRSYLDFKERGGDKKKSRWKTAPWWDMFLQGVDKVKLQTHAKTNDMESKRAWFAKCAAPVARKLQPDELLTLVYGEDWKNTVNPEHLYKMAKAI